MIITPRLSTRSFHSNDHQVVVTILVCAYIYIYLYYIYVWCRALLLRKGGGDMCLVYGMTGVW